jgi:hypothetical protein
MEESVDHPLKHYMEESVDHPYAGMKLGEIRNFTLAISRIRN